MVRCARLALQIPTLLELGLVIAQIVVQDKNLSCPLAALNVFCARLESTPTMTLDVSYVVPQTLPQDLAQHRAIHANAAVKPVSLAQSVICAMKDTFPIQIQVASVIYVLLMSIHYQEPAGA